MNTDPVASAKTALMVARLDGLRIHMKIVTDQIGEASDSIPASVVNWAMKQLLSGQADALRMIENVKQESVEE